MNTKRIWSAQLKDYIDVDVIETVKRDIRLYYYEDGTLRKMGKGKTGINRHIFDSIESCKERILKLKTLEHHSTDQFVITEYFPNESSIILEIIS